MKTKQIAPYQIITKQNYRTINRQLTEHGGWVIIVGPGHRSHAPDYVIDVSMEFFKDCRLDKRYLRCSWSNDQAMSRRTSSKRQLQDRSYWLRKKDRSSGDPLFDQLRESRECLTLTSNYRFEISPQCTVLCNYVQNNGTTYYVRQKKDLALCFTVALTEMVSTIQSKAAEQGMTTDIDMHHIGPMVTYIMLDLKTGKMLRKNIAHGKMADAALGM